MRVFLLLVLLAFPAAAPAQTVFGAASLTDALNVLNDKWTAKGEQPMKLSFAASSALARQIEQGAPADIFASADEPWMDYVQKAGLIVDSTRVSALGNSLVLIAPANATQASVTLAKGTDIAKLLGANGRLAIADPAGVPAGKYGKDALTWMGAWDAVSSKVATAENVRATLLLVERGEAPLGIVYATDAAASKQVKVVATFPADSHAPITYPFALLKRAAGDAKAKALFAFLTGAEAKEVYRSFGFVTR
ncbi:molybdate ABC transporter substrate-binding protein [Roseiterribacter gracilis]|uniref:Molybdate ABC transporter substrate-binding protein n=1 Tax=Roseiterribacter gracilis TaxID=2812848 RepID=A0A8S8XHB8_9PROT|nr:molybdate ABC transporter substrate-binding protein [Rhodospirillales bacterium TMPK1]